MNQYHKLYTPQDSAVVFIDHQPQMLFGAANADRATLINNVTLLAKVAKEFNVPAVLTAVETEGFSGYIGHSCSTIRTIMSKSRIMIKNTGGRWQQDEKAGHNVQR